MPTMSGRSRDGFTLLEVLVALSVSGFVVLAARTVMVQLTRGAQATVRVGITTQADVYAERTVRALLLQTEAGPEPDHQFNGTSRSVDFRTSCLVTSGWRDSCRATMAIVRRGGDSVDLAVWLSTGEHFRMPLGTGLAEFLYLGDPRSGVRWLRSWEGAPTSASLGAAIH
jgi:prepilin-type N-terminal cleavage/methylation domain-containing protein